MKTSSRSFPLSPLAGVLLVAWSGCSSPTAGARDGAAGGRDGAAGGAGGGAGGGSGGAAGTGAGGGGGYDGSTFGTDVPPGTLGNTQCTDGLDNDHDGLTDYFDPECIGVLDDNESTFATGIPGDNVDPCKQDCFF